MMIGQTISHYKILEKLGEGGMGVVYKAQDLNLDRIVALKFLPANLTSSQEEVARFQQEAKAISSLSHPNIAVLYDLGESESERFLILEYLSGGTLKSKVKELHSSGREIPIENVLDYGVQIAEALGHAHRHGVVHRDVKTDNVMLTEEGRVKITDFGLAKLRGSAQLTKTGSTVGTAAYMSPEQIRGDQVDHRSDLFSLGVVLYELATGRLPFRGEHEAALSYSIVNEDPTPLSSLRKGILSAFERVIMRCLEKDGTKRYQSAADIVSDLQSARGEITHPAHRLRSRSRALWAVASITVLACAVAGYLFFTSLSRPGSIRSIAVLPLENLSGDPEQEYFADGMTDALIATLAKIGVRVISRTSVMQYKGLKKPLPEIARELNVDAVVEGSVLRSVDRVRITAQLIHAPTDEHLWAETYERDMRDVLTLQSEVAQAIAQEIKITLTPRQKELLAASRKVDREAYEAYLKGRYYWNKRTEEALRKSIEYFEQSIERDPTFALAYAGLADSYAVLGSWGLMPSDESSARTHAAALKALEIDPSLGEPHASIAGSKHEFDWDFEGAEREFKRAIELSPNYATAHQWYAELLVIQGRFEEAIVEIRQAQKLDPLSLIINASMGSILFLSRQYEDARLQINKTLEMDPNFPIARLVLGLVYEQQGLIENAIEEYEKAISISGRNAVMLGYLGHAYGLAGKKSDAHRIIEELKQLSKNRYVPSGLFGLVYGGLGEKELAIQWLERGIKERDRGATFLKTDPRFDNLRSEPRFAGLLKKVGFEQ